MSFFSSARRPTAAALAVVAVAVTSTPARIGRADAPVGRYVVAMQTVKDTQTGLMWQQTLDTTKYVAVSTCMGQTICDGQTYCANLTVGGLTGWRLPTVQELMTIVDETKYNPSLDTTAFPDTPYDDLFDTQSVYSTSFLGAWWGVQFNYGVSSARYSMTPGYVRCVQTYATN
jgi:Protein of unknown function (DUF1566)